MANDKVYCRDCKCWSPASPEATIGDCKRHSPVTFEGAMAVWPRTMKNHFCFEGIEEEKPFLNEDY